MSDTAVAPPETEPEVDVFAEGLTETDVIDPYADPAVDAPAGEPESAQATEDGGIVFEDVEWPVKAAAAPREKRVNPFQARIDSLLIPGFVLPSRATAFTDKDDDQTRKDIRRDLAAAAGDRATAILKHTPIDGHEGWARYTFRLEPKRHRTVKTEAAAPEVTAPTGAASD